MFYKKKQKRIQKKARDFFYLFWNSSEKKEKIICVYSIVCFLSMCILFFHRYQMSATQIRRLRFDVIAAMMIVAVVNNCYFVFGFKYFTKWPDQKEKQEEKQWIFNRNIFRFFPIFFIQFSLHPSKLLVFIVLNAVCFERNGLSCVPSLKLCSCCCAAF